MFMFNHLNHEFSSVVCIKAVIRNHAAYKGYP